jgi:small subunit ribosomal protein S10
MAQQEIKLRLKSFDHRILDKSVADIVRAVKRIGSEIKGPIPMPSQIRRFTVNRSPHIDKKSREQFEIRNHFRLLIVRAAPQAIDALMKLDLAAGVDIDIELVGAAHE